MPDSPRRPARKTADRPRARKAPPSAKATPRSPPRSTAARPAKVEIDVGGGVESALAELRDRAAVLLRKGRHTSVRLSFRGTELATVPLAVLVAAEAATFWWAGLLRVLAANLLGKAVLEVELVSDADTLVARGRDCLMDGDMGGALARFREALEIDPDHAQAHLNLGVALRLRDDRDPARWHFERAAALDPEGTSGREARRQLEQLGAR